MERAKNPCTWGRKMYRKKDPQVRMEECIPPFHGTLDPNNRWVKMAHLIPWDEFEDEYASYFGETGNVARPLRMALGTLIIKEKKGTSNEDTVQEIMESRYLQYFIGLRDFVNEAPFDQSAITRFAQRLGPDIIKRVNQRICEIAREREKGNSSDPPAGGGNDKAYEQEFQNKGKIILDATCAPSDIRYPTDVSLLNEAREKLESMIDTLHEPLRGIAPKPRTYRKTARKEYLRWAKKRGKSGRSWRKALRQQLGYVGRDLRIVDSLLQMEKTGLLSRRQERDLNTIRILFDQQREMYDDGTHQVENRIVSIHQPYIRPIKRGKIHADTEFGAKVSISMTGGYTTVDRISWDNYNEAQDLIKVVERYKEQHGAYPEVVQADQIYRNRKNRAYCKEKGIRLSGPPLGRPPKDCEMLQELRWQTYQDACERNAVEGKIGESKRCGTLGRITARLQATSETQICVVFLVRNLQKALRDLLRCFLELLFGKSAAFLQWHYAA